MTGPDKHDCTAKDHERFEAELLVQDQDVTRVATADVDESVANRLIRDLVDTEVVTPVPDQRVLVHEPSKTTFKSMIQLAVFHRGWTAARDDKTSG
jgi:hypothetical protein